MAKKLKDAELEAKLSSERPDKLVILTEEDTQAIVDTVKALRAEIEKLKGKSKS